MCVFSGPAEFFYLFFFILRNLGCVKCSLYNPHSIQNFLPQGLRVLIYNGDTDMACNFLGDEWFVEELGRKQLTDYKAWFSKDERGIEQVAGYSRQFEGISFVTVKVRVY